MTVKLTYVAPEILVVEIAASDVLTNSSIVTPEIPFPKL